MKEPSTTAVNSEERTELFLRDGSESVLRTHSEEQPVGGVRCPIANDSLNATTLLNPGEDSVLPAVTDGRSLPNSTTHNATAFCVCDQGTAHPYQSLRRPGSLPMGRRTRTVSNAAFFNPGQGLSVTAVVTYHVDNKEAADRARLLQRRMNEFFAREENRSSGTKNDGNEGTESHPKKERVSGNTDNNGATGDAEEIGVADVRMGGNRSVLVGRPGGLGVIEISDDEEDFCRCDEVDSKSAVDKGKEKATAEEGIVLDSKASRFASLFRDARRNAIKLKTSYAPTYTPLQRWEFENGLPVSGVSDVETWAAAVGLARDLANSVNPTKKLRTAEVEEPPKYGSSTFTITDIPDDEHNMPSPSEEQENEQHSLLERRRKGKEKEDNLQD